MTLAVGLTEEEIGWNSSTKRIENLSEREIRKLLNPYLEPENDNLKTILNKENDEEEEIKWNPPDDTFAWYPKFNNGIWVIFVHNDDSPELKTGDEIVIDKIIKFEESLPTPPNYSNLKIEYQLYKKYGFDTKKYESSFIFFDDEEYLDGEDDEENCYIKVEYLETPFDWNGYERKNWWISRDKEKEKSSKLPGTIMEALARGENHFVEFKPGLINWPNSNRDIEYENIIAICAFLNARGGYLFIGVADKENKILGLSFPKKSKDLFLREFTRIKAKHLPPFIAHSINGDFLSIEGKGKEKEIFVVTVYPSSKPIFLRKRDEHNRMIKEFYIRSDASSRHLYDIEEVVKYCKNNDRFN